jgi:hypothetical protein
VRSMERHTPHDAIAPRGLLARRTERYRCAIPAGGNKQVRRRSEELFVGADSDEAWKLVGSLSLPWMD